MVVKKNILKFDLIEIKEEFKDVVFEEVKFEEVKFEEKFVEEIFVKEFEEIEEKE